MSTLTARNAGLADIVTTLNERKAAAHDLVVPATKIRSKGGLLVVAGVEDQVEITPEGVTTTKVNGTYRPTTVADEGISAKLDIPLKYLRRTRETAPDLFDANVNGWLHGRAVRRAGGNTVEVLRAADERKFLLRTIKGEGGVGVLRAFLSDSFKAIDDLDFLLAGLAGIEAAGVTDAVITGDLTERRMYLDVAVPSVRALAPALLGGYRDPFSGTGAFTRSGGADTLDFGYGPVPDPIIFAGFRLRNSEVGQGRAAVTPRIVALACTNGMTITNDEVAYRHSGGRLQEGIVDWSATTYRKTLDLITSETTDAVKLFLSPEYLAAKVAEIEAKAGRPVSEPETQVREVTKSLGFTLAEQTGVLAHFIRGGQLTAGGVVNAVTSFSQTLGDADRAADLDAVALRVLDLV